MPFASQDLIDYATRILANGTVQKRKEMITTAPILPPSGGISKRALGQHSE